MLRGYVRHIKTWQAHKQVAILLAAGVPERSIYRDDAIDAAIKSLRAGDVLAVAGGLRVVADNRRGIRAIVDAVHGRGVVIMDAESKRRTDKDGVSLLDDAVIKIRGERTMTSPDQATKMQAASVLARIGDRMPIRDAQEIWRDPTLTMGEALARMKGWTQSTAYRVLKERGIVAGRKPHGYNRKMRMKKQRESDTGSIYFCRANGRGPVKIGYASVVEARIKGLQTSHHQLLTLLGFIDGTHADEKALHKRFKTYHIKGEWFRVEGALKKYLETLPKLPED